MSNEETICLDCNNIIEVEVDIQLCDECMKTYDTDKLWKMHDNNEIDALDFNENKNMRKKFKKL
jgi:hypothetical protein